MSADSLEGPLVVQRPPRTRDELMKEAIKYIADKYGETIVRSIFKPIDLQPKKPATSGGVGALALVALVVLASKKRR